MRTHKKGLKKKTASTVKTETETKNSEQKN